MFGINIWCILIIILLAYCLYYNICENIRLRYELNDLRCEKKEQFRDKYEIDDTPPENKPKKSRELYSKMNSIVQKNLGISLREMVLGKK